MSTESAKDDEPTVNTGTEPAGQPSGFSTTEKIIGVAAAYQHPLGTGIAATAMLKNERDPVRRDQLTTLRDRAVLWWSLSAAVGAVVLVVVLIAVVHSGAAGGSCKGGADKSDPVGSSFQSTDDKHWTATYPCNGGGSTTLPIARNKVPGLGR